ncbi:hypothetical protein MLD38_024815 [Melastoma candidum]|uniref:Uncharacterized protein n=1 Tax=Melastoma candidum TaxID=119954 RepID=A0ACB9NYJ7_9MYRT|nr:hypothetical protein MLD38_024815 [Melastoma candidum]
MTTSRILFASFIACLLVVDLVHANQVVSAEAAMAGTNTAQGNGKINCGAACAARCLLASRHKMCMRACRTCCARCNCVPPGTSGNRDVCRCYATMTTHGGRLKCP